MRYFKLQFFSGLHVDSKGSGEPESALEFIRSDTLSAAVTLAWYTLYQVQSKDVFDHPPFRLSSAFPYVGNMLLFPCPVWRIWSDMDVAGRKQIKDCRWISQGLLEKVLAGTWIDFKKQKTLKCGIALTTEELTVNPEIEEMEAWKLGERQRVSVDRIGSPEGGNTFFFALQAFAPFSGLYFLAEGEDKELERLESVVTFLGDTGLGADRNSGLGHFRIEETGAWNMVTADDPDGFFTLSLFNPGPEDDIQKMTRNAAYDLDARSGWIVNSTLGRPPIRVFSEGSFLNGEPKGRIVDMLDQEVRERFNLKIEHSAPRDYRAFSLPCSTPPYLQKEGI